MPTPNGSDDFMRISRPRERLGAVLVSATSRVMAA